MPTWRELEPDPAFLDVLEAAGRRPTEGSSSDKRNWGNRFADACALMVANALRRHGTFRGLEIRPNADGSGTEALTGVGGRGQKKVDVIASTLASGLQVAISLKAENFPSSEGHFGKNLKNRLYELQDEVRAIHEYQPRAHVVGLFFLPLSACEDRRKRSTFERTVANLRARTGRIDFSLPTQLNRLDWAAVGLYVPHDPASDFQGGTVRYFDVGAAPPLVGRPSVDTTMDLEGLVDCVARDYLKDTGLEIEHVEPEWDPEE